MKKAKKMALATLRRAKQVACFLHLYARVAGSPSPILSSDSKQSMNLAVRFVADSVNLRTKLLPRRCGILIAGRL
jgi:hypothetical protein